jgi:hypothetical protein
MRFLSAYVREKHPAEACHTAGRCDWQTRRRACWVTAKHAWTLEGWAVQLSAVVKHLYDVMHTAILRHGQCMGQSQPQQESHVWQYGAQGTLIAADS